LREEVVELFEGNEVDPLIDGEGFYTATEQNLFSDDDTVKAITRTYAPDEDLFAQFVELQLKIQDRRNVLDQTDVLIKKIQDRLDLAQKDQSKRLSKELYGQALTKLVELIGSKKLGKEGRKQILYREIMDFSAQREEISRRDHSAIWSAWFQLENPEEFLKDYLGKPFLDFYDSENIDNQSQLHDESMTIDCIADEHIKEMLAVEGLAYQDDKPVKNSYVGPSWYNMKNEWKINQDAIRNSKDEEIFQSLLTEF
jgi:hypothetical protein